MSQIPLGSLSTETPRQQPQLKLHQHPSNKFCTEDTLPGACSTFCTETLLRYLLNTVHGKHSISHRQCGAQTGSEGQRGTALTQTKSLKTARGVSVSSQQDVLVTCRGGFLLLSSGLSPGGILRL